MLAAVQWNPNFTSKIKKQTYIIMETDEFKFKIVNTRDNKKIYEGSALAELLDILESSNKKQIHGKNI